MQPHFRKHNTVFFGFFNDFFLSYERDVPGKINSHILKVNQKLT